MIKTINVGVRFVSGRNFFSVLPSPTSSLREKYLETSGHCWPRPFVVIFEKILHSRLFRFGLDLFLVVCIQI